MKMRMVKPRKLARPVKDGRRKGGVRVYDASDAQMLRWGAELLSKLVGPFRPRDLWDLMLREFPDRVWTEKRIYLFLARGIRTGMLTKPGSGQYVWWDGYFGARRSAIERLQANLGEG